MCVINHNWSVTKQRLRPQSVAEISRHSVLSGGRIRQCGTSSGSHLKDTEISVSRHFLNWTEGLVLFKLLALS